VRLKKEQVDFTVAVLSGIRSPSARRAAEVLLDRPRAAGLYRLTLQEIQAVRAAIVCQPPSKVAKTILKRLDEAIPAQLRCAEVGDDQSLLTDAPDAGQRKRARHRTGGDASMH